MSTQLWRALRSVANHMIEGVELARRRSNIVSKVVAPGMPAMQTLCAHIRLSSIGGPLCEEPTYAG